MTLSCTTTLWEARPSEVPKGLTLGNTQKDSADGTLREQSGPGRVERVAYQVSLPHTRLRSALTTSVAGARAF